jgi:hypothetical protein
MWAIDSNPNHTDAILIQNQMKQIKNDESAETPAKAHICLAKLMISARQDFLIV